MMRAIDLVVEVVKISVAKGHDMKLDGILGPLPNGITMRCCHEGCTTVWVLGTDPEFFRGLDERCPVDGRGPDPDDTAERYRLMELE